MEDQAVLGGIVLRPFTNETVLRVGHVGYGVRPSARGRGLASWALREALPHARNSGLQRLLLVCLDDNPASIKTIERCGGRLHRIAGDGTDRVRQYLIDLWLGVSLLRGMTHLPEPRSTRQIRALRRTCL